jgi:hypothetical protein
MTEAATQRPTVVDQADRAPRGQWANVWDQFKTHKGALLGACVFIAMACSRSDENSPVPTTTRRPSDTDFFSVRPELSTSAPFSMVGFGLSAK